MCHIFREDFPAAWMNLGIVLANLKQLSESENAYKKALMYRKKYTDCYYNLGNLVSSFSIYRTLSSFRQVFYGKIEFNEFS